MSLTVEDGTGKADAETYISVVDATAYHAARGNAAWAALASDTVREQLLRKATEFMLEAYRQRWQGYRISQSQALDWPRAGVCVDGYLIAINTVPEEVRRACALLALRAIDGDLNADPDVAVKRKKVGPIDVEYFEPSMPVRPMRAITELLRPFLAGGDMNVKVVRA